MSSFNTYTDALDMAFLRDLCIREGMIRHFYRGECLVRHGERLRYWGYIESGYFKYSVYDKEVNERITGFAMSGTMVGDYFSLTRQTPVSTNIVAAQDSEVYLCSVSVLQNLLDEMPMLRTSLADALFHQAYLQYLDLFRLSPKERYIKLLRRCPDILQTITLRELASYLHITPTHLSRIRRKLSSLE